MTSSIGALDELSREHEVVQPLLERLVEVGERLRSGEPLEPRTVRTGVGLLEAYLHRVHANQLDHELVPAARAVAMPGCFDHLDRMGVNHQDMQRRAQQLLGRLRQWARGDDGLREEIARGLIELASEDHSAAEFEETYPLMCLQTVLPPETDRELAERFERHAGTRGALEANIARFLAATASGASA